jgi:1-deoxy-D-xylulose-5-phosphate reductoisomerase
LANKEFIVAAGNVFHRALANSTASVIPVDSEHNAVFQVLNGDGAEEVEKVTLTASGGPFRDWTLDQMAVCTVEQAVAHPNWSMGPKISVDSATLMNKGLELISSFSLRVTADKLDVPVHPQSIVHCPVAYAADGRLAHLFTGYANPDCALPGFSLASPSRRLIWRAGQLTFARAGHDRSAVLALRLIACGRAEWHRF